MEPLLAEGIVLRSFEDGDASSFADAARESGNTVGVWMPWWRADYSAEEALRWFEACREAVERGSGYDVGIFLAGEGRLVGGVAINRIDRDNRIGNIGYWIRESEQNRGLCSTAVERIKRFGFEELGLVRLEIVVHRDNLASRRVAEKVGAKFECIAEKRLFHQGEAAPAAIYSLMSL